MINIFLFYLLTVPCKLISTLNFKDCSSNSMTFYLWIKITEEYIYYAYFPQDDCQSDWALSCWQRSLPAPHSQTQHPHRHLSLPLKKQVHSWQFLPHLVWRSWNFRYIIFCGYYLEILYTRLKYTRKAQMEPCTI